MNHRCNSSDCNTCPTVWARCFSRILLLFALISPTTLVGQDTEDETDTTDSDVFELEEFRVSGFGSALATSLAEKRDANQVIDSITAEEIGQFGDQNLAEAIQRLSGVSLTRNNGEGESVTIRGLSPTFTRVEIDGRSTSVTVDSSDPERASVLSTFAADLYSSIEVVKSPTASDVEGGIGGTVRLSTPSPFSFDGLSAGFDVSYIDADLRDEADTAWNGYFASVNEDKTFGFLIFGTYETRDRRVDKIQSNQDWIEVEDGDLAGGRFPGRVRLESRTGEAPRTNVNLKLQLRPTPELELYLNTLYTIEERDEDRARLQVSFNRGRLQDGTLDASTGTLTSATFDRQRTEFRTFNRLADVETVGLTGGMIWENDIWHVESEFAYTSSEEDFTETRIDVRINRDGLGGYDTRDDAQKLVLFTAGTDADFADLDLRGLQQQQRVIVIEETDWDIDARRIFEGSFFTNLQGGFRWAETTFERSQGNVSSDVDGLTLADAPSPYVLNGDFGFGESPEDFLRIWPSADPVALYEQFPSPDTFVFDDPNFFTITEENTALYLMADFDNRGADNRGFRGNIGTRFVNTDYTGEGRQRLLIDGETLLLDGTPALANDYLEILPAVNFVWSPGENGNMLIRGAWSRALTRPTIDEINPSTTIDVDDDEVQRGNPDLEPFLAWQYDLGWEYYFGEERNGVFSISAFYKDVENFIVADDFTETLSFPPISSDEAINEELAIPRPYQVSTFRNGGSAEIQGVEFNFQLPMSIVSEALRGFGIAANYTYTDSEFTDAFGNTNPFPGASDATYNLIVYYETGGFSTRLAYNYRDDYLVVPSSEADGSNAQFGEEQGRLDLAVRYRFENGFRLTFDILNITEEEAYLYYDTPQRLENFEFEGRIVSFGIGYTY